MTADALRLERPATDPAGRAAGALRFDEVYEAHFDLVWRTARRLGVPEVAVEDVCQDVFVVVHRRLADFNGASPLRAWIIGIAAHVVRDHRRRYLRKTARCVSFDESADSPAEAAQPAPLAAALHAERVARLYKLLEGLDDEKREVFVLAQLEELTMPEIATALGLNVNTVSARLRAARRAFDEAQVRHAARSARRVK